MHASTKFTISSYYNFKSWKCEPNQSCSNRLMLESYFVQHRAQEEQYQQGLMTLTEFNWAIGHTTRNWWWGQVFTHVTRKNAQQYATEASEKGNTPTLTKHHGIPTAKACRSSSILMMCVISIHTREVKDWVARLVHCLGHELCIHTYSQSIGVLLKIQPKPSHGHYNSHNYGNPYKRLGMEDRKTGLK